MSFRSTSRFALLSSLLLTTGCGWKLETRDGPASAEAGAEARAEAGDDASAREPAPAFSLPNDDGAVVSLDELLADGRPAVLVFYRGHW